MKKSLKKVLACIVVFSMVVALTACTEKDVEKTPAQGENAQTQESEPVKISFWHLWTTENDANAKSFNKVFAEWQKENPDIEVELDATENEAYKTKLKTALAANEAPDVFFAWGGGFAKPFAEAGEILALDAYLADGTKEKLLDGALDNFIYTEKGSSESQVYGLPFIMWTGILYCNEELFEQNNVKIPDTYDELMEAVEAFNQKGIVPLAVGGKDGWPAMFYHNVLTLRTAGADLCNAALKKEASFAQPEFVEGARLLNNLVKKGGFDPGCLGLTLDEAKIPFLNGEIPMLYQGSWLAGEIQDEKLSLVKDKVVAKNFPAVAGGKGDKNEMLGGAIDCFMVNADTQHKEAAVKFVKEITQRMTKQSFMNGAGIPTWKVDISDVEMDPLVQQIVDLANKGTGYVLAWDTSLVGEYAEKHKTLVQQIFTGEITPEEFVKEMQKMNQ